MGGSSEALTLEIERILPAARPAVFAAFANQDLLSRWWGPEGFAIAAIQFEPRVGEQYRIEMQPPDGEAFNLIGEFREVDPPSRLAFTFVWAEPDPDDVETLVELTFRGPGEGTEVALRQGPFKTEARWELHRDGWGDSFDKLERLLSARS